MNRLLSVLLVCMAFASCQESLEDRCARETQSYTKKFCPAPAGENIIIDSLTFERITHTLCYYYTLTGKIDDPAVISRAKPKMQAELLNAVKDATNMKVYKDEGYAFKYTYYSSKHKGEVLFTRTFTKKDYKK